MLGLFWFGCEAFERNADVQRLSDGIAAVPHGFRSSFRDWAAERTSIPREVVEAALAHTVQNSTEVAYARAVISSSGGVA